MIKYVHTFDSAYRALNRNFNAVFIVDNVAAHLTGDNARDQLAMANAFDGFYRIALSYGIDQLVAQRVFGAMVYATRDAIEYSLTHRGI